MSYPSNAVSLHPYFMAHAGKLEEVKAFLPKFVAKTSAEKKNLYYDFTLNGHHLFCREAYVDAQGVLDHLTSVGPMMQEMMKIADLTRVEVHGPAAELDKLRDALKPLKPIWFIYHSGVRP